MADRAKMDELERKSTERKAQMLEVCQSFLVMHD